MAVLTAIAQGQREDGYERERGILRQHARRVPKVADQGIEEGRRG